MVTWAEYLVGILGKILESYSILTKLNDKPGDLVIIEKELLKITGFFNVVVRKLNSDKYDSKDLFELKPRIEEYLNTYYFEKEIKTMSSLYSDDTNRIKNIRLKILESFEDKKLISRIQDTIDDL